MRSNNQYAKNMGYVSLAVIITLIITYIFSIDLLFFTGIFNDLLIDTIFLFLIFFLIGLIGSKDIRTESDFKSYKGFLVGFLGSANVLFPVLLIRFFFELLFHVEPQNFFSNPGTPIAVIVILCIAVISLYGYINEHVEKGKNPFVTTLGIQFLVPLWFIVVSLGLFIMMALYVFILLLITYLYCFIPGLGCLVGSLIFYSKPLMKAKMKKAKKKKAKYEAKKMKTIEEEFKNINKEEAEILKELREMIQRPLPIINTITISSIGVKIENTKVIGLGLFKCNLHSFPEIICNLRSLRFLSLRNNEIPSLPEFIGNLSLLESFDLFNNKLKALPESIGNLTLLKEFDLRNNQLSNIPESIGKLKSLRELHLFNNQLVNLPDSIGDLKSLKILGLSKNKLSNLPYTIESLSSLQELDISHNYNFTPDPKFIENLEQKGVDVIQSEEAKLHHIFSHDEMT